MDMMTNIAIAATKKREDTIEMKSATNEMVKDTRHPNSSNMTAVTAERKYRDIFLYMKLL